MSMTKDMINGWLERNDTAMEKASEWLADALIENFLCKKEELKDEPMLRNATDLDECDEHDIETFFSLLKQRWDLSRKYDYTYGKLEANPYSIREWNKKEKGYGGVRSIFTEWLEENYQEVLPDDLLKAVRERHDIGCIVNSYAIGGGGYEVIHDLYYDAKVKFLEIIKREIKKC